MDAPRRYVVVAWWTSSRRMLSVVLVLAFLSAAVASDGRFHHHHHHRQLRHQQQQQLVTMVSPFVTTLHTWAEWNMLTSRQTEDFAPRVPPEMERAAGYAATSYQAALKTTLRRGVALVLYSSSWCGAPCSEARNAFHAAADKLHRHLKVFRGEVVMAEAAADQLGGVAFTRMLSRREGVSHFPAMVIYAAHLPEADAGEQVTTETETLSVTEQRVACEVYGGRWEVEELVQVLRKHVALMRDHLRDHGDA